MVLLEESCRWNMVMNNTIIAYLGERDEELEREKTSHYRSDEK